MWKPSILYEKMPHVLKEGHIQDKSIGINKETDRVTEREGGKR